MVRKGADAGPETLSWLGLSMQVDYEIGTYERAFPSVAADLFERDKYALICGLGSVKH